MDPHGASFAMPTFDAEAWAARLAGAIEVLLDTETLADAELNRGYARVLLAEYQTDLRRHAQRDNVIDLHGRV